VKILRNEAVFLQLPQLKDTHGKRLTETQAAEMIVLYDNNGGFSDADIRKYFGEDISNGGIMTTKGCVEMLFATANGNGTLMDEVQKEYEKQQSQNRAMMFSIMVAGMYQAHQQYQEMHLIPKFDTNN